MTVTNARFIAVDFYCGAGGTTRGLLDANGYVICGIDNDSANRETFTGNNKNTKLDGHGPDFLALDMFPEGPDYPEGQQHEVWQRLRDLIPRYRTLAPGVPLMFAICAPCQSFTKFVQRNLTPDRTRRRKRDLDLLSQTVEFIREFRPEVILSENVATIKSGPYQHIWNGFRNTLQDLGYIVGEDQICASRFGVPQFRRRSVLLAMKSVPTKGTGNQLPVPQSDPKSEQASVGGAIGHLPSLDAGERCEQIPNHACRNLTEVNRQRLMSVRPGEPNWGFSDSPYGDLSLACHRRLEAKGTRGFGDVYTRMRPDRPAPTITTRFHSISNGRFGHYDEQQVRGLSLREGAALQSFRDDYVFHGRSVDTIARMIGNAVPPKLSAFMADWLAGLWEQSQIEA